MMTILLRDVWAIDQVDEFKLHFARWNGDSQPLEVFIRDKAEWQRWQEYRPARDDFNRPFIFALARFYHEPDTWLFGGIFRVKERHNDRYDVELLDVGRGFIGRLKLHSSYRDRTTRTNFENHYGSLEVQEILREPYSGRQFPGYDGVHLNFDELETLVKNDRPDWKAALANAKGIYLISDTNSGKRYVGAAYGDQGLWSRWCNYVANGHGGNVELRAVIGDQTLDYCRTNFQFALLEHRPSRTPDEVVLDREKFWKGILLTRGKHGLNRN